MVETIALVTAIFIYTQLFFAMAQQDVRSCRW